MVDLLIILISLGKAAIQTITLVGSIVCYAIVIFKLNETTTIWAPAAYFFFGVTIIAAIALMIATHFKFEKMCEKWHIY